MTDNHSVVLTENSILAQLVCDPALGSRRVVAENVRFIRSGEVRLYQLADDGSQRLLEILGPGDWFGAEAVAGLEQYDSQALAVSDCTIYMIPAERCWRRYRIILG